MLTDPVRGGFPSTSFCRSSQVLPLNILVIGPAKTGTTIISKTIHHAIAGAEFHMEPKNLEIFLSESRIDGTSRVVKVIYEHWKKKPHLFRAIVNNELPLVFDRLVTIVRDPRDEWISRIMYFPYVWAGRQTAGADFSPLEQWVRFIRGVETNPQNHSFVSMLNQLNQTFHSKIKVKGREKRGYWAFCNDLPAHAHQLRYEDFVSGRLGELEQFLGMSLSIPSSLGNLDRTMRSASFNNWKALFKQEDVDLFRRECGDLMETQGYTDWELEPVAQLDSASYSGYLRRVLAEYLD